MDPSYNGNSNGTNPGGMTPGAFSGNGGANPGGMTPGMFPGNNMPVSSGTGDIVLAGGEKKQKKWLVIVGLVALIAVVIAVVWFLVFGGNSLNNNKRDVSRDDVIASFNRLINYAILGEERAEELPEPDDSVSGYYLTSQPIGSTERNNTMLRIEELFHEFEVKYDAVKDIIFVENTDELQREVDSSGMLIGFLKVFSSKPVLNRTVVQDYYLNAEKPDVIAFIDSYYDIDELNDNYYLSSYSEVLDEWARLESARIDFMAENGCFLDKRINYGCIVEKNNAELSNKYSELLASANKAFEHVSHYYQYSIRLISNLLSINDLMIDRKEINDD